MEKLQIPIDSELNAIVPYDNTFRFFLSKDNLNEYDKGFVNWHKQPSIEISIVYEGAVNVLVLENEQTVVTGDGFFIMPGFLHSIRQAPGYSSAKYFTLIFYPEILYGTSESYYNINYYRPMVDSNIPFFIFNQKDIWTKDVFPKLKWIADQCPDESPAFRLQVQHILQNVWASFATHLIGSHNPSIVSHDTKKILNLVSYLHSHYQEKFSLTKLSENVSMSRNECCRYFKHMMNMTITEYLLEFRLSKAVSLLESSNLNITEIAAQTGFCDVSYFIKMFHKKTGITPKVYADKFAQMRK